MNYDIKQAAKSATASHLMLLGQEMTE